MSCSFFFKLCYQGWSFTETCWKQRDLLELGEFTVVYGCYCNLGNEMKWIGFLFFFFFLGTKELRYVCICFISLSIWRLVHYPSPFDTDSIIIPSSTNGWNLLLAQLFPSYKINDLQMGSQWKKKKFLNQKIKAPHSFQTCNHNLSTLMDFP